MPKIHAPSTDGQWKFIYGNSSKDVSVVTNFSQNLTLISAGGIPRESNEVFVEVLKLFKSKKNINRTISFYLVDSDSPDGKIIYISISGDGNTDRYEDFKKNIDKIKVPSKVELKLIPFRNSQTNPFDGISDEDDYYDKIALFGRLLELTTASCRKQDYAEKITKFNLNEQHQDTIKCLSKIITDKDFQEACRKYNCENKECEPPSKLIFKLIFFSFEELLNKRNYMPNIINNYPDYLWMSEIFLNGKDISLIPIDIWKKICWELTKEYYSSILESLIVYDVDRIHEGVFELWEYFYGHWKNISFSQAIAHCAEDNLFDFLFNNKDVIRKLGEHYIFSIKASEEIKQNGLLDICQPCIVCDVNLPANYNFLHLNLFNEDSSPKSSGIFQAKIIQPPSQDELNDVESLIKNPEYKGNPEKNISCDTHIELVFRKGGYRSRLVYKARENSVKNINDLLNVSDKAPEPIPAKKISALEITDIGLYERIRELAVESMDLNCVPFPLSKFIKGFD